MDAVNTPPVLVKPLAPVLDDIPDALKKLDIWVPFKLWAGTNEDGTQLLKADGSPKLKKEAINIRTGRWAESNNDETWCSYDQAVTYMTSRPGTIKGLGLCVRDSDPYSVIDLDGCINEDGELNEYAKQTITSFNSYTEISPSGRGLHIFVKGKLPKVTTKDFVSPCGQDIELFCNTRFITMTGIAPIGYDHLTKIENRDRVFKSYYRELCEAKSLKENPTNTQRNTGLTTVDTFEDELSRNIIDFDLGTRKEIVGDAGDRGWQWEIQCPWKEEHSGGEGTAFVTYFQNGTCGFHCFHSHCKEAGRKYKHLAEKFNLPTLSYVDEFNAKHAVINVNGKICIMNENTRLNDSTRAAVTFTPEREFHLRYANKKQEYMDEKGNMKVTKLSFSWLSHEDRRTYDDIVFEPGKEYPYSNDGYNIYNLFKGWIVQPNEDGDCSLFLEHVYRNICGGNKLYYHYLTSWVARQLQDPGSDRPGVAVVLRGDKGTGKGVFAEVIMNLMKPYSIHVAQAGALTSHFNQWLQNKLLVYADEAFFAGKKTDEGQLKHMITDSRTMITPKGINSFEISNHLSLLVSTNIDWAVPASSKERRWFVLDVLCLQQQNTKYFGKIIEQLKNGGYEKLMNYYMTYDYDMELLRNPPLTQGLIDQKLLSLSPVEEFWYSCLENNTIFRSNEMGGLEHGNVNDGDWGDDISCIIQGSDNLKIDRQQVYNYFTQIWCKNMRKSYTKPLPAFISDLANLCPGIVNARQRCPDGGRKMYFVVKPLDECKILWDDKMHGVDKSNHAS